MPTTGVPLLGEIAAVGLVEAEADGYDEARAVLGKPDGGPRVVLGQIGGTPSWIQGEEVPDCENCGRPMTFAAFHCTTCATGAFLWQQ